jgi:VIT1/CCC1 family predicted Fe2+/Mn2+ transporter
MPSPEHHRSHRAGWLRAAVLGANDGVVSIAGLVVGVAASGVGSQSSAAVAAKGTSTVALALGRSKSRVTTRPPRCAAASVMSVKTRMDTL